MLFIHHTEDLCDPSQDTSQRRGWAGWMTNEYQQLPHQQRRIILAKKFFNHLKHIVND